MRVDKKDGKNLQKIDNFFSGVNNNVAERARKRPKLTKANKSGLKQIDAVQDDGQNPEMHKQLR